MFPFSILSYSSIHTLFHGGRSRDTGGKGVATQESNTLRKSNPGHLCGSVVERLPLAQVVILGSSDRVPHQAPHGESASPSAYVSASLCLS